MRARHFAKVALGMMMVALIAVGQETLTNESIVKLVKAGFGEDLIVNMVNQQPGKYSTGADDLIALKQAGVSDKVIAAMVSKGAGAPAGAPVEASAPARAGVSDPSMAAITEVGVYYKKNDKWEELLPEVVNWKTGGVLKSIASAGIVKGDINGTVQGPHSRNSLKTPVEILIYAPEGVSVTEYQLIRMREKGDRREFRTVTGGVLHVSGGATRDLVPFEGKKVAPRMWTVVLPNLGAGEYGFLSPGAMTSSSAAAQMGKVYSFRLLE